MRHKSHPHECLDCRRLHRRPLGTFCQFCEEVREDVIQEILTRPRPLFEHE